MVDPKDLRSWLFAHWPGCSNGDCVVRGKTKGMHTNGSCSCVTGADRSHLNLLSSKLKAYLSSVDKTTDETPSKEEIFLRVTSLASEYDTAEDLLWGPDHRVAVMCNDVFFWACADAEEVGTHEDIDMLVQAWKDAGPCDGGILYCARKRGMRPQGAMYGHLESENKPLFDAAGPERDPKEPGNTPKPKPKK